VAWDRMADDPETAEAAGRQVRAMFRFADDPGCRHERLCGWFGEVVEPCGDACDFCSGADLLAGLPAAGRGRSRGREKPRERRTVRLAFPDDAAPDDPGGAEADPELFEALRAWRAAVAKENGVPAYLVFSDATLAEVALQRPRSADDLLEVKGIGPRKLEAYGEALLALVRRGA